jgi:hypothetical protein
MIFSSLISGFAAAWRNKRMIVVYYLANFLFALVLMLPMYYIINSFVGYSLVGQKLANRMDMDFLMEFLTRPNTGIIAVRGLMLIVPALYWLFGLFLSGGAFFILISKNNGQPPQVTSGDFSDYFSGVFHCSEFCIPSNSSRMEFNSSPSVAILTRTLFGGVLGFVWE